MVLNARIILKSRYNKLFSDSRIEKKTRSNDTYKTLLVDGIAAVDFDELTINYTR